MNDKWNLEEIFESEPAWEKAREELAGKVDEISAFKGKISNNTSAIFFWS